jgi:hypothetical protein
MTYRAALSVTMVVRRDGSTAHVDPGRRVARTRQAGDRHV